MKMDGAVEMSRLESTPGVIGPERGLIFQSDRLHPMATESGEILQPEFLYQVEFWDCKMVAVYLADEENEYVNPETAHGADHRFFAVMHRKFRKDLHPSHLKLIGAPIRPNQMITFFGNGPGSEPFTLRVQTRGSMNPVLVPVDTSKPPFGLV